MPEKRSFEGKYASFKNIKFSPILIGLNCLGDAIVVASGETLSAHSVRPRKMPGWIVPVWEIFCKRTVNLVGFLPGFVSLVNFREFFVWFCLMETFWLKSFSS